MEVWGNVSEIITITEFPHHVGETLAVSSSSEESVIVGDLYCFCVKLIYLYWMSE